MEGCAKCIKYLVFFFNLIFWLAGCAILGVGIWVRVTQGDYATLFPDLDVLSAANIAIAAGAIVMVVGFVGCLGAIKENQCLLIFFFILLMLIFILEIAAGILGLLNRDEIINYIESGLADGLKNYNQTGQEGLTGTWDRLQNGEECCGVVNASDWWKESFEYPELPDSCCEVHHTGCGKSALEDGFHEQGCEDAVKMLIVQNMYVIGGVGIGIAFIQILGMIFAMVLVCEIRKEGGGKYA